MLTGIHRPGGLRVSWYCTAIFSLVSVVLLGCQSTSQAPMWQKGYPAHWWAEVEVDPEKTWEILPQQARSGEVILSKRHELGLLSNFAATPFKYRGKTYASLEGFWQAMKFPEGPTDPRLKSKKVQWHWTREQVEQMTAFEAKRAGDEGSKNMNILGINWVSFEGNRFPYRTKEKGKHYQHIVKASWEKLRQNQKVKEVLLATGDLRLRPDHYQGTDAPPAWRYYEIWEEIRTELRNDKGGQ